MARRVPFLLIVVFLSSAATIARGEPVDSVEPVLLALREQRFADLEAQLSTWTHEQARTREGRAAFGVALEQLSRAILLDPSLEPLLPAWRKAHPRSARPDLVRARVELRYAWKARGRGYASSVTEKGWEVFHQRVAAAEKALQDGQRIDPHDVEVAALRIETALLGSEPLEVVMQRFADAIAIDPASESAHAYALHALDGRWLGSDEMALAFAREMVRRQPSDPRLGLLLVEVHDGLSRADEDYKKELAYFREPAIWAECSAALERYLAAYPEDPWGHNRLAWLAWRGGKKDVARREIERIGTDWIDSAWTSTHTPWPQTIRQWALGAPASPAP